MTFIPADTAAGWGLAQAVLPAWWYIEDTVELGKAGFAAAEIIAAVRP